MDMAWHSTRELIAFRTDAGTETRFAPLNQLADNANDKSTSFALATFKRNTAEKFRGRLIDSYRRYARSRSMGFKTLAVWRWTIPPNVCRTRKKVFYYRARKANGWATNVLRKMELNPLALIIWVWFILKSRVQ